MPHSTSCDDQGSPLLLDRLLREAPARVVFGLTPEREAAQAHLAALLIHQGREEDVVRHRYAFSLGLASGDETAAYAHYFKTPDGGLIPITTVHTPGIDDLGGLVHPAP
ncbi:MAG: hypothetical protein AAFQ53_00195 [Bacteroidota bacterium]